ncbi:MAG: hypothetical protein KDD76_02295 [Rickettsiales bacterium]|nr:hypothetical protein [Rickettsiales bacterium]
MKKSLLTIAITGALLTGTAFAANTNGYPDYPASHKYQRTYERQQYWNQQASNTSASTPSKEVRCSNYPKSAEYQRRDRRLGLDKKCN